MHASDPQASVWVAAHAGSGKTTTLIERVTRILLAGTPPERILCLTFTKAAAAEMANRLHEQLSDLAFAPPDERATMLRPLCNGTPDTEVVERASTLLARTLETPGGLKIQTIHAFCERLIGRFPIESGISPDFQVLDENATQDLYNAALGRVIATLSSRGGHGQAMLDRLALRLSRESLDSLIGALAKMRHRLNLDARDEPMARSLARALDLDPQATEATALAQFIQDLPRAALQEAARAMAAGNPTDQKRGALIAAMLDAKDPAASLDPYARAFLREDGTGFKNVASTDICRRHQSIAAALAQEQARVMTYFVTQKKLRAHALAEAALYVGRRVLRRFREVKRVRGLLDFDDLIEASGRLLTAHSGAADWVLYKLDGGLDHILVDEAQDTNPRQWQVIAALANEFFSGEGARVEGRTVFAVGDEKQSIYSFQGADPAIFETMRRHFQAKAQGVKRPLCEIGLPVSRRSVKPVLDVVDAVFADETLAHSVTSSGKAPHHSAMREGQGGLVELWPLETRDAKAPPDPWTMPLDYQSPRSPRIRLACKVADTIADWLRNGTRLESQDRPIRPGDILILVQTRQGNAFVEEVIRRLKIHSIPVAGADRLILTSHIAVMDLMVAGNVALLPEDDLSLATLLRSPLIGLSEEQLFSLAQGRRASLWEALEERVEPAFAAARELIDTLRTRADFETPFTFFMRLLGPLGGRARLIARLGVDAIDPLGEFLRLALDYERLEAPSLQGFLHWLERAQVEIKRDMDHGRDEVRVMTVHGAKGLEAPIVFLPETTRAPKPRARPGLLWPASGVLPFWCEAATEDTDELAKAREEAQKAAIAESHRLLYVALTRARDRLYVCGWQSGNSREEYHWHGHVARALRNLGAVEESDGVLRHAVAQTKTPDGGTRSRSQGAAPPAVPTLPDWINAPPPREAATRRFVAPTELATPPAEGGDGVSPQRGEEPAHQRFQRGRLIHRLLEILPELPPPHRAPAAERFLALPVHELSREAQLEIAAAVQTVLRAPGLAPLFGTESRAEVPLAGSLATNGGPLDVMGVVDRLYVDRDRVIVIDYKTNRIVPEAVEGVPQPYLVQMATYRALLQALYPGRTVEALLLWTHVPRLMALPDGLLDMVWGKIAQAPAP